MRPFAATQLPTQPTVLAPDGSEVRVLLALEGGSMAHFALAAGQVAHAVTHRTVDEIWYVVAGLGEMWRRRGPEEEVIPLTVGTCLTIPQGTQFQFRAAATSAIAAVVVTMPPRPGADEAIAVQGPWGPNGV